jgi:uncharacterized protein YlbG (UPF0298 family)
MKEKIKYFYKNHPLKSILILAFAVRLLAVVYSQGYGFHDDHFLVIEAAQSWVDGNDWNLWMPWVQQKVNPNSIPKPQGHSLVYSGVHYLLFKTMEFVGVYNPKIKMFVVRLLHALFSLLIVFFGYRIVQFYTNNKIAKQAGLILALLWLMPFLSVHNLVEIVCVPFVMWALWLIIKNDKKGYSFKLYFIAGFIMMIAASIRFQTVIVFGGVGLVLLFKKQWKQAIVFGIGGVVSFVLLQSVIDYMIWGKPFVEFAEYVRYNIEARNSYGHNYWYMYTTVLLGVVIPPLSIFLFSGWFMTIKRYPLIFWPSFLFFAFHNFFPNKQERFILPILPLFIIAGVIGWWQFMDKSKFWNKHKKIFKVSMIIFWTLNMIVLPVFSTTYSKKSRCETMVYLGKLPDAKTIVVEESVRDGVTMLPMFYGAKDMQLYTLDRYSLDDSVKYKTKREIRLYTVGIASPQEIKYNNWAKPDYVVFINEKDLDKRVAKFKKYYPDLKYIKTINPSRIDLIMRKITPSNNNQLIFIYHLGNK